VVPKASDTGGSAEYAQSPAQEHLISEALGATYEATSSETARVGPAVETLIAEARRTLEPSVAIQAEPALKRLADLARRIDAPPVSLDHNAALEVAEGVYLLRGLIADPDAALQLIASRAYIAQISVPKSLPDLRLDLAVASEQLSFAALVQEPGRVSAILAAVDHFRRQYRKAYVRHHEMYWQTMSGIQGHLLEAQSRAMALARLNSLTELGPSVGEMALESIDSLAQESEGCALAGDLADALAETPVCPGCGIRLDQQPPLQQAEEALSRLDRAVERQLSRLSSVAIRGMLERSADPRVERFLRIVQAAQLSSLAEVLDDPLTNYLRRFLLEARINAILDPMLEQVERGEVPEEADARAKLSEMAGLIDRATRATRRELPPGKAPRG
jgi:hypothetical protein